MGMNSGMFLLFLLTLVIVIWALYKAIQKDKSDKRKVQSKVQRQRKEAQTLFELAQQQDIQAEDVKKCWGLVSQAIYHQELTLKGISEVLEYYEGPKDSQVLFIDLRDSDEGKQALRCSVSFISDTCYCDSAAMRMELSQLISMHSR